MTKKIIIIAILFITLIVLIFICSKDNKNYDFEIYFFNAGKADAIIITKNDKHIMIDTGEESLSKDILNYFYNNNIKTLDYLIITHFDKDHVGSASTIIDNIEVKEVLQSNVPKDSEYYNKYIESLNKKGITPITVSGDKTIEDLQITVNGPTNIYDSNESNNSSLIVSIINGENSFLFMGDSENARIKDFISSNSNTYDFIKIPYHGNYLKQLDNLLENTNSKYGVITCSSSEGCEDKTLDILNKYNIKYYLTRNGSIRVLSDRKNITIKQ